MCTSFKNLVKLFHFNIVLQAGNAVNIQFFIWVLKDVESYLNRY